MYHLLALCARAECDAVHCDQLARAAAQLTDWQGLAALAESHGMAPLLYTHLKTARVQLSPAVRRELQGLYVRHRQANQVRMRVLYDIIAACNATGIQAIVLKGAALANLVYAEPALRPMSDLDLIVSETDLLRTQSVLIELGFAALPSGRVLAHRHLEAAALQVEGVQVQVEIHHRLFSNYFDNAASYLRSIVSLPGHSGRRAKSEPGGLAVPPRPFALADQAACTLGHEDMLWHLCQHLASHVNIWDYARLIWVADIVSYSEHFASEIDWKYIRRRRSAILDTLSLLHFMTPLSEGLLNKANIKLGRAPEGIGMEYRGWPRPQRTSQPVTEHRRVLRDTLFPSEWWLRLRYKLGSARPLFWYRWVRHPLYIFGHVMRAFLERMGWPTPLELAKGRSSE